MNEERLPRADLYIAPETYRLRQQLMRERFERMLAYASNEEECRSTVLERYFGTEPAGPCGVCDICLARRRAAKRAAAAENASTGSAGPAAPPSEPAATAGTAPTGHTAAAGTLRTRLLERLSHGAADPRTLADELAASPERIAEAARELLAEGKIATGSNGKLEIIA